MNVKDRSAVARLLRRLEAETLVLVKHSDAGLLSAGDHAVALTGHLARVIAVVSEYIDPNAGDEELETAAFDAESVAPPSGPSPAAIDAFRELAMLAEARTAALAAAGDEHGAQRMRFLASRMHAEIPEAREQRLDAE